MVLFLILTCSAPLVIFYLMNINYCADVNAVIVCEFRIDTGNIFASQVADESAQAEVSSVGLRCLASARVSSVLI